MFTELNEKGRVHWLLALARSQTNRMTAYPGEAMRFLESNRLVARIPDTDGSDTVWRITTLGHRIYRQFCHIEHIPR
jgi:hypothetical protein